MSELFRHKNFFPLPYRAFRSAKDTFIERVGDANSNPREQGFTIVEVVFASLFTIVVTFAIAAIALGATDVLSSTQTTALMREKPDKALSEIVNNIQQSTIVAPLNYNSSVADGSTKYGDKKTHTHL